MILRAALLLALLAGPAAAADHAHHHVEVAQGVAPHLVEADLVDRDGRALHFPNQVAGRDLVVMDFVYTSCTTTCLVSSAMMAELQARLGGRKDVRLVSLSLDPANDTPAKLNEFARRFEAGPGWLWATGAKPAMDSVLKGLGTYTADFANHSPTLLVGDPVSNSWRRLTGMVTPDQVMAELNTLAEARSSRRAVQGKAYFGDGTVIDHKGRPLRFWSDVLEGHTVLINLFYTSCDGTCPMVAQTLAEVQESLGDRLGKDVRLLSISVDPARDTPKALAKFAARYEAKPGWLFLTGKPDDHAALIRKLGHLAQEPEDHIGLLMLGNVAAGRWVKVPPNEAPVRIAERLIQLAGH